MEACSTDIPRIRQGDLELLPEPEVMAIANAAKALSDPIRLQMLYLLSQHEDLCTCEFEELLGLGQSKVSYHLNVLLQAGFVTREHRGTWSHYRLHSLQALGKLRAFAVREQASPNAVLALDGYL